MCIASYTFYISCIQKLDLKSFDLVTGEGKSPQFNLEWKETASQDKKTCVKQVIHFIYYNPYTLGPGGEGCTVRKLSIFLWGRNNFVGCVIAI